MLQLSLLIIAVSWFILGIAAISQLSPLIGVIMQLVLIVEGGGSLALASCSSTKGRRSFWVANAAVLILFLNYGIQPSDYFFNANICISQGLHFPRIPSDAILNGLLRD